VAAELAAHVRASDTVARLGGDEFAVLMWNVIEAQAAAKAHELETIIGQIGVMHGSAQVSVGASAGIVPLSAAATPAAIIDAADKAMYVRKKERRG
jgi:diguanylate cyclase (GGDEF)-like protein